MSMRIGGNIIADATRYVPSLLDFKWADHILNDISWLRADTFSWQDGGVYEAVYNHLEDDIDGKSLQSETIGGTTVQFYLADDGHKICPAAQESNVAAIFTATGVAWYYIIDTVNEKFKLPRTKFGVTGLRDTVGGYVEPGLPNITGDFYNKYSNTDIMFGNQSVGSGALKLNVRGSYKVCTNSSGSIASSGSLQLDASESNAIYGNSTTVQPAATQMYLYFYVGTFTHTALENTAGITAEQLNDKVDVGHQVIAFQAPTAQNDYTWYRKYADGWVEQGGIFTGLTNGSNSWLYKEVALPITMSDTNYTAIAEDCGIGSGSYIHGTRIGAAYRATTGFRYSYYNGSSDAIVSWEVSGMAAS